MGMQAVSSRTGLRGGAAVALALLTLALVFCLFDLVEHDGEAFVAGHCFGPGATVTMLALLVRPLLSGRASCESGRSLQVVAPGTPAPPPKTVFS